MAVSFYRRDTKGAEGGLFMPSGSARSWMSMSALCAMLAVASAAVALVAAQSQVPTNLTSAGGESGMSLATSPTRLISKGIRAG